MATIIQAMEKAGSIRGGTTVQTTIRQTRLSIIAALIASLAAIASGLVFVGSAQADNACPADHTVDTLGGAGIGLWTNCATTFTWIAQAVDGNTNYSSARIAPDRHAVAFVRSAIAADGQATTEIFTTAISGGPAFQVTHTGAAYEPAWSPDSSQLVYTDASSSYLYRVNADGTGVTRLTTGASESSPAWCLGNKIVFLGSDNVGGTVVRSINAMDGGSATTLTPAINTPVAGLACSPDGAHVFFTNTIVNSWTESYIATVPVSGGQTVRLTSGGLDRNPTVSSDWTLGYDQRYVTADGKTHTRVVFQWLGGTSVVAAPYSDGLANNYSNPSFVPGASSPPPAGFPAPSGPPPGTPVPTPTPSPSPSPTPPASRYVALGDSFSSGEGAFISGNASYLAGTDVPSNRCHRSINSYAERISGKGKFKGPLEFHACSGAIIADFYSPFSSNHGGQNVDEPNPQSVWLDRSTKVVTLTIGGNDALFGAVMDYCAKRFGFERTCQSVWQRAVDSAILNLSRGTGSATDNLPDLFRLIRQKAPNAAVVVLGYPRFFPRTPPLSCWTGVLAPAAPLPQFTRPDMLWINSEIAKINRTLGRAANLAGFAFVDAYDAFDGHELCSRKPWMNRVVVSANGSFQQSYHPNGAGQKAFAALLLRR